MVSAKGYDLVQERITSLPTYLRGQVASPLPDLPKDLKQKGVLATGVGSSEASARYLVYLLNRIGIPAEFAPLSSFYSKVKIPTAPPPYLAIFTQGLSPNSGIGFSQRHSFAGTLLFTSSTIEGQEKAGKSDRAELLRKLESEGATLLVHPYQNEYEILPRFIGPLCSLFEVCRVIEKIAPGSLGGQASLLSIPTHLETFTLPQNVASGFIKDLSKTIRFIFTHSSSEYAQNLPCKFLEALFIQPPHLLDAFTYSHGPFQLDIHKPSANWVFTTDDKVEQTLFKKLKPLFEKAGSFREIQSPLTSPLAIFHYEAFLNQLVLHALKTSDIDLVNWPGKDQDDEGYRINSPGF